MHRNQQIAQIQNKTFDLVIIGGGITGAGVLLEASKLGLEVLLIEKGDFASGTSSKSAKLVHGGLRYLQYLHFGLVRESLTERNYLLETYPHLVKAIEFVYPLYESGFKFRIGMILYQLLGKQKALPKYKFLNKQKTLQNCDFIDTNNLKGSFSYFDGITHDARLTAEIIFEATQYPNARALNYVELMQGEQKKEHYELTCQDRIENQKLNIKTKFVANCSGAWTDLVLNKFSKLESKKMAPSKGVHLVFSQDKIPIKTAYAFSSYADDGRKFYALPWQNNSVIIGVTDTEYAGNLDKIPVDKLDIDYMLHAIVHFFPTLHISKEDIIYKFVGLRPLFDNKTASKDKTRDYKIWWSNERLLSIAGGKLTTFRSMAKALLKEIPIKSSRVQKAIPIPTITLNTKNEEIKQHIENNYGIYAPYLYEIINKNRNAANWISPSLKVLEAEIIFFVQYHHCRYLADILDRRLSVAYVLSNLPDKDTIIKQTANILQEILNLPDAEIAAEIESYYILHDRF
jgi:glycerol-3-phosphate dehydrogenase